MTLVSKKRVVTLVVFVAILTTGAVNLSAQVITDTALQFISVWQRHEEVRGDCGGYKDTRGRPLTDCSLMVPELPMNERARAWLNYVDDMQSPTLDDCAAITVVNLIGDVRPFSISFKTDRVIINYEHANIIREVWMDGRGHPPPTDLFYQGHSIGHWEGKDLVFESTNFTFEVDGLDDHLHFPSSPLKKVIERYSLLPNDEMRIVATITDPVFLTRPLTVTHTWKKSSKPMVGWWECDPTITRREMELTAEPKYRSDDR